VSDDTLPQFDLVLVTAKFTTSPARVQKGTKYALIFTRASSFGVKSHNADVCLGDCHYKAAHAGNFSELGSIDLLFTAWVR
jgi:hypothetical protein